MKLKFKQLTQFLASIFVLLTFVLSAAAVTGIVRQAAGNDPATFQQAINQFRADIGGANNGVGGSFTSGRREINWDGVADQFAEPNALPPNFFNFTSPRGVVFNTIEMGSALNQFSVSANSTNPTGTAVEFGNINPTYPNIFLPFSPQRLFAPRNTTLMEVTFFIPGTRIPATVSAFGVIFTDVDSAANSRITLYAPDGSLMTSQNALALDNGMSFVGVSFNAGERIARVVIQSGTHPLSAANTDGQGGVDVVAMDDFIYGEPRAMTYHPSDFDGDGATDRSIFRPSTGEWFILNSGSGTLTGGPFGANGDIPVEGDFDGDQRSDLAIWRPSTGQWIILGSSNNQVMFLNLGSNGDRPVPGDYDKDGKTDPAVWRASNTGWYFLRSSTNYTTFDVIGFGIPGDIPVPASPYPYN